jgi:hypothetical protein
MKTVMKKYEIETQNGSVYITAADPFVALGIFRKRGANGLGKGWSLTRQPNGWIVATNRANRTLERQSHRLKEVGWKRGQNAL